MKIVTIDGVEYVEKPQLCAVNRCVGFTAPKDVPVHRQEIYEKIEAAKSEGCRS